MAKDKMVTEPRSTKTGYPEESGKKKLTGIIPDILGGLAILGGTIPSLIASPEKGALKRYQQGQGAGAMVARQTGSEAAQRVLRASTAQPSSGRGGNLREGLRAADELTQRGASGAARIGAQEGLEATRMLRGNQFRRLAIGQRLGAGVGQMMAGVGGMLAAARDQGKQPSPVVAGEITDVLPGEAAIRQASMEPGYPAQGEMAYPADIADQLARVGNQQQQLEQQRAKNKAGAQEVGQMMQPQPQQAAPSPEQAQRQQAKERVQQVADVTAQKQDAGDIYQSTAYGAPVSPAMTDPFQTQEWIYNQVMNYNPATNQGMSPQEAEETLLLMGFPVDYSRLVSDAPGQTEGFGRMFKEAGRAIKGAATKAGLYNPTNKLRE